MKRLFYLSAILFLFMSYFSSCSAPKDTSSPTINFIVPSEGQIYQPGIVIRGTASDNDLKAVFVQIDNGNWQKALGTSMWIYFPKALTSGVHQVQAYAIDGAGNKSRVISAKFYIDRDYPDFQIVAPYDGERVNSHSVQVRITAKDDVGVAKAYISLDGGEFVAVNYTQDPIEYTFKDVNNGEHVIRAYVVDKSGKKSNQISVKFSVVVDHTPPVVVIGTPKNGKWYTGGDVFIAGRATDDYSGVKAVYISLDGGNNWEMVTGTDSWMMYYPNLPDRKYNIMVKAVDNVGNESTAATLTIFYDADPPKLLASNIEDGSTIGYSKNVTYSALVFDAVSLKNVEFTFTDSNGKSYESSVTYPEFTTTAEFSVPITPTAGENYIHIHMIDVSGHESDYYSSFYLDMYPPLIEINSQHQTPPSNVELAGTISDYSPVTYAVYRFDNDDWKSFEIPQNVNVYQFTISKDNLGTSEHTLIVEAWDEWGNKGTLVYNFYYDVIGPVVTIQYPPHDNFILGLKPFKVSGIANDIGSGIAQVLYCVDYPCYVTPNVNGGKLFGNWNSANGDSSWSFTVSNLTRGIHKIHVFAIDLAGNYGYASTVSVNIAGDTIYLSKETGNNYNSGVTTTAPLKTFDYAYEYALERGFKNILIAKGAYDISDTFDTSIYGKISSFSLKNGINLYGGYSTDFTYYNPFTYPTFISTTSKDRVFVATNITEPTVISGLFIYNGDVTGSTYPYGGGMLIKDSNYNLLVTKCTFYRNKAKYGGGIAIIDSVPHIEYSRFATNTVTGKGGGLFYNSSSYSYPVTFDNLKFAWNIARETDEPAEGGGAFVKGAGNVIVRHSIFYENGAGDGGGLNVKDVNALSLEGVTFDGNRALLVFWSDGKGGGLYSENVPVTIQRSLFVNNSAYEGGGMYISGTEDTKIAIEGYSGNVTVASNMASFGAGAYFEGGMGTINGAQFEDNSSSGGNIRWRRTLLQIGGGGIYVKDGKYEMSSSSIVNNSANSCGGIGVDNGVVSLIDTSIQSNRAKTAGGGLCVKGEDGKILLSNSKVITNRAENIGGGILIADEGRMLIENSIVVNNMSGEGGGIAIGSWDVSGLIPRLKLEKSEVSNNRGYSYGGGIYLYNIASVIANDSVFEHNSSYYGGMWYTDTENSSSISIISNRNSYIFNNGIVGPIAYIENDSGASAFNFIFENDTYKNNQGENGGFYIYNLKQGDFIEIKDGSWNRNGNNRGSCLYIGGNSAGTIKILDNKFYDNKGNNYIYLTVNNDLEGIKILNNVFVDTTKNSSFIIEASSSNPVIVNNTFWGGYDQLYLQGWRSSGYIINNVFSHARHDGVRENNSRDEPQVLLNNDFYVADNCLYEDYEVGAVPTRQCLNTADDINNNVETLKNLNKNNIDSNPGLNNINYYEISINSPLVDAGYDPVNDPDGAGLYFSKPWRDIDGQLRPYDVPSVPNVVSAWDIGADEYEP